MDKEKLMEHLESEIKRCKELRKAQENDKLHWSENAPLRYFDGCIDVLESILHDVKQNRL